MISIDIGAKLKDARIAAQLTQEQTAEALGVSRQTVSNWENEKTYPDIVSVIRMSDLYAVSLDHLLKGGEPSAAPDYMNYLAESTDTVNSRRSLSLTILLAVYLSVWAFSLLVFWCFTGGSDAMGYSLMFLWILLPVTTFLISLLMGKQDPGRRKKWLVALFFGVMYMLAEYGTFQAANMIAFDKLNPPSFGMIPAGALISFGGLLCGTFLCRRHSAEP